MKCGLFGINHSTGSMIDVNQRLEHDTPGADQVPLNAEGQMHFTAAFSLTAQGSLSAPQKFNKRTQNSVYQVVCYYHK